MAQKFLTISAGGLLAEATETGVTSVTGTAPVVSSGGAAPVISMAAAAAGVAGYVSTAAQTFDGVKTFTNGVSLGNENLTVYDEGTWTPGFATWATAPSVIFATYTRIGRQVTVALYSSGGICTAGSTITGLPFTSNANSASSAWGGGSNNSPISGSVIQSSSTITNLPLLSYTGVYWQITAVYFV